MARAMRSRMSFLCDEIMVRLLKSDGDEKDFLKRTTGFPPSSHPFF